jgi:molybdopterin synthase sulfur carrier subunit
MRVLLFDAGRHRRLAQRAFEPAPESLALKALIAAEDAALGAAIGGPGVQAAVDRAIVRGDARLSPTAEVAFLPPMTGG